MRHAALEPSPETKGASRPPPAHARSRAPGLDVAGLRALQRSAGNRAVGRMLARGGRDVAGNRRVLARWRIKQRLESPDLDDERLQQAVSSAALALNVGVDEGVAVTKLQSALRKLGYDAPLTGKFDAETQRANARFQAKEGIPYPTGRQAGPKTLSALDDALLNHPDHRKECGRYEPGERERSASTPGHGETADALGTTLTLWNFEAGKSRMKPSGHEDALDEFIRKFDLFDPESEWEVEFIRGFTDAVDAEDKNWVLREARADDVQFYLQHHGVPSAPNGQAADVNSYDHGCDPHGRSRARRVIVRLRKKHKKGPCDPQRVADARKSVASAETALAAAKARLDRAKADEVRLMVSRAACGLMGPNKGAEACYQAHYPEQQRIAKEMREAPIAIRDGEQALARAKADLRAAEQEVC